MIQRMFVTLDTKKTNYKNVGKINHGDDLILELTVLSDGDMISFNDPMVDLLVKKSDGKMIRQNSGIEHIKPNKFVIEVMKDCVTSPGLSTNQLIINDNGRISTCMFYYTILNSLEEDIIQSISNVEVLEQLDEFTIQMKDKMENFDEELQNRMSELEDAIDDLEEFFGDTGDDLLEAEFRRNEAEQSRAQAESIRVQNENRRLQNDLDLANAEAERVRAENIRIQNEVDRALVDAVMDQKESKREDSELERIQNESKRATDEVVRQQKENTRQSNESIRMSNETDRKTQENRRATAETNRVNAETTRRNNENSRISNESERQKVMNEMKSLLEDARGFDDRVGVIEDEIGEINSSLETMEKNKTSINIFELGAKSSDIIFNATSNKYEMNDISSIVNIAIEKGYNEIIIPQGNYLIDTEITLNRTVTIKGYNANIYSTPTVSTTPKTIFNINAPYVRVEGLNFISVNMYNNKINASDSKGLTSNVCALAFDNTKDCIIDKCSGYGLTYFSSIMNTNNILITNCDIKECYFGIYTGFGAKKINIENTNVECQIETDKYGHAFYFGYDSDSITVNNCRLFNSGVEGCNIIKVGSNEGHATNIKVNNCIIDGIIKYNLFYLHTGSDLEINNCNITINCPGGYGRVFQYGTDSMCLINNTVLNLDGFDRFSTEFISNNSILKFNSSSLYISNKMETYSRLPFVCGAKLMFENCLIDYSGTNRGGNLMDSTMNHFELYNCKLILNTGTTLGSWSGGEITYTKNTSPVCIMVNTVIDKKNNTSNVPFFGYIKNSEYTPIVLFSNITCIDCESKGGKEQGKLSYTGAETDYNSYNNVVNVKFV